MLKLFKSMLTPFKSIVKAEAVQCADAVNGGGRPQCCSNLADRGGLGFESMQNVCFIIESVRMCLRSVVNDMQTHAKHIQMHLNSIKMLLRIFKTMLQ